MKRLFLTLCLALLSLMVTVHDADAKRLGGGRSTGMQRESVAQRATVPPQAAPSAPVAAGAQAAPATAPKRNWLGPLAGLAAGLGIAALLSHFGLGEGMANILMIAGLLIVGLLVAKLIFRRRDTPISPEARLHYAGAGASNPSPLAARELPTGYTAALPNTAVPQVPNVQTHVPEGFDVDGFLRVAKLNFVRLQAANDAGNLDDLREFVSPEMFAEIKLQLDERAGAKQQTDVVTLNAELLEVVTEAHRHVASVRFSGMIREEAGAAAAPFDEVWNLSKPIESAKGWVVAGIQQMS